VTLIARAIISRFSFLVKINNGQRQAGRQRGRKGDRRQPPAGLSAGLQDFSPVIAAAITTNYGDNYHHYAAR